jgi:hypothetical protein
LFGNGRNSFALASVHPEHPLNHFTAWVGAFKPVCDFDFKGRDRRLRHRVLFHLGLSSAKIWRPLPGIALLMVSELIARASSPAEASNTALWPGGVEMPLKASPAVCVVTL